MAAILDDGPRVWAVDTLNRKLGRVAAMSNGMLMLLVLATMSPGPARLVVAVAATALILYACRPQPTNPAASTDDLAEVEALFLQRIGGLEDWRREHQQFAEQHAAQVVDLVAEIRDQLR